MQPVVRPPQYAPPLQVVTWTANQSGLVTLTFDLLTLELLRNVSRVTDNRPANFGASVTFRYWVTVELNQTDDVTL